MLFLHPAPPPTFYLYLPVCCSLPFLLWFSTLSGLISHWSKESSLSPVPILLVSLFLLLGLNSMVNRHTSALARVPCPLSTLSICVAEPQPWRIQLSSHSATTVQCGLTFKFMITMTVTKARPIMLLGNDIPLVHSLARSQETIPGLPLCRPKAAPPPPL